MKTVIASTKVEVLSVVEKQVSADIYMVRYYMKAILKEMYFDNIEEHEDGDISLTYFDTVTRITREKFIATMAVKVIRRKLHLLAQQVCLYPKHINGERVGYYINLYGICLGTIDLDNYVAYYDGTFNSYTSRELMQIANRAIVLLAKKQREVK